MTESTREAGADFSNKKLRNVDFTNARIVGASMVNASFDGDIFGLKINGIEVQPLITRKLEGGQVERVANIDPSATQ